MVRVRKGYTVARWELLEVNDHWRVTVHIELAMFVGSRLWRSPALSVRVEKVLGSAKTGIDGLHIAYRHVWSSVKSTP